MPFSVIADVHLHNHRICGGSWHAGLNSRARIIGDALRYAITTVDINQTGPLISAGDLFDTHRPEPQIVELAARSLSSPVNTPVWLLRGNHDICSSEAGDDALQVLSHVPNLHPVHMVAPISVGDADLLFVPFQAGRGAEWLEESVRSYFSEARHKRCPRAVVTHLGIHDASMRTGAAGAWMESANDAVSLELVQKLCADYGIDAFAAGNWHSHRSWRTSAGGVIAQVGALCPTGWDNPGLTGYGTMLSFAFSAGEAHMHVSEIPGPRFLSAGSMEELRHLVASQGSNRCPLFGLIKCPSDKAAEERAKAAAAVLPPSMFAGIEVRPDGTSAKQMLRAAALGARCATTLRGAVSTYLDRYPVPEGQDREVIRGLCAEFLGSGA